MPCFSKRSATAALVCILAALSGCQPNSSESPDSNSQMVGGIARTIDSMKDDDPLGYTVRVKVEQTSEYGCTGSLIAKRVVLSAAHCGIIAGNSVTLKAGGRTTEYRVQNVITEDLFDQKSFGPSEESWADVISLDFAHSCSIAIPLGGPYGCLK